MGSISKSVVLLSAGLDSSVNLLMAIRRTQVLMAITFDYGQRAAAQEITHAKLLTEKFNISHRVLDLTWMKQIAKTSLVNWSEQIPTHVDLTNSKQTELSAKKVWVPNRNGIFLNIAAGFAESLGADKIIPGFNLEEASTFPDNSLEYIDAVTNSFKYSTANQVQVECYTTQLNKSQIVELGFELGLNFDDVWPCYFGDVKPCGVCESCLRFTRALQLLSQKVNFNKNENTIY